jgi:dGTPase
MDWNKLLSTKRLGQTSSGKVTSDSRTQFQRDFDRLIFSSPFRRLQNKTQVFPLPGSVFVHNRLTHSLEVASVGRSLGNMISERLVERGINHLLLPEIGAVVSAACLAHDLGNPPFGHSGEDAIKEFFKNGEGKSLNSQLSEAEWTDLIHFDGNANSFRILSHQFKGRRAGGFALTYTMLASIVKYPYESVASTKAKFGFFQSDKNTFREIAAELGLNTVGENGFSYVRHPLVYLVEAADDICYQVMDLEDAHKLKILSFQEIKTLYMRFFSNPENAAKVQKIEHTLTEVTDSNEQIAYLRTEVISLLVNECVQVFMNNYESIMAGNFHSSLMKNLSETPAKAMKEVIDVSVSRVYVHPSVIEIELAGYRIISTLLSHFIDAMLNDNQYNTKLLKLFPEQFISEKDDTYSKIQSVVDFISGMTDVYALDLYRKITGISLPGIA